MEVTAHDRWKLIGGEADVDPIPAVGLTGPGNSSWWVPALLFSCGHLCGEMTREDEAKALGRK